MDVNDSSRSLAEIAVRAARTRPGAVGFLVPRDEGHLPVTYEQWLRSIRCLAATLLRSGVRPRDRVLLMMETRYEWLLCDLAILSCGAWTVPIYPTLPSAQLSHPVLDSGATIAICGRAELAQRMLRAPAAGDAIRTLFQLDGLPVADPRVRSLRIDWGVPGDPAAEGAEPAPSAAELEGLDRAVAAIAPEDPATIIYTSGTSSAPKGVVLSHTNILSNARMVRDTLHLDATDRYLSFLPLSHVLERTVCVTMVESGVAIAFGRGMESIARDAMAVRPTILLGVPRFFEQMLRSVREAARSRGRLAAFLYGMAERSAIRRGRAGPRFPARAGGPARRGLDALYDRLFFRPLREKLGGAVRLMVSGSAPLGTREAFFFCGAGIPLLEGYGLTEAGPVVSVNRPTAWRAGSVGPPLEGVAIRIEEDGEILVKSPSLMTGYLNLEAESLAALRGGWLHTGDLGRLDDDGFLWITGRKKDLIVTSGGKNVSPQPIEDLLRGNPFVEEAVVFGDRRPHLVALILPNRRAIAAHLGRNEWSLSAEEIRSVLGRQVSHANHHVAAHERIRNFDLLAEAPSIEAGTLTPSFKVRRSALEAQCAEQIAALYEGRRS